METLSLKLPDSLHRKLKKLAVREGISINHLVATAIAEKVAALSAETYLSDRAARGRKLKFRKALTKVSSAAAVTGDNSPDA